MPIKNIKSTFFIPQIFSFINDKVKLKILQRNKYYQNLIGVSIINYKILSQRCVEYRSDGKVKEYSLYNDQLIFEGEYLNGKRNGKGKEYDLAGELIFEGEYLNGKRNGHGREYNDYDLYAFDGEFKNGKKWNGTGCDRYGNIINEFKEGKGFIKEIYSSEDYFKVMFEGEYVNGERNGKGTEMNDYGTKIFDGEYKNGKQWNGKGYDGEGNVAIELKNGMGDLKIYLEGHVLRAEGKYLNGETNGKFKMYTDQIVTFDGEYLCGKKHGSIKEYDNKGLIQFDGIYINGHKRSGKSYIKGKLEYEGEYLFNKKFNGKGYDENGNVIYELKNGTGKVKEYDEYEKLKFEGEYLNGKRNGHGKEYDHDEHLVFEGEYLNGKKWKGKFKRYDFNGPVIYECEYLGNTRKEYRLGKLIFEGEYLNEKKWNGKGYDKNGQVIYEIKDGKGTIKEYFDLNILRYEGEYSNGLRNGKGKEYNFRGDKVIFEGEFLNGKKWNGKATDLDNEDGFEGEIVNGRRWNGKGKEIALWETEIEFDGEYINGVKKPK